MENQVFPEIPSKKTGILSRGYIQPHISESPAGCITGSKARRLIRKARARSGVAGASSSSRRPQLKALEISGAGGLPFFLHPCFVGPPSISILSTDPSFQETRKNARRNGLF